MCMFPYPRVLLGLLCQPATWATPDRRLAYPRISNTSPRGEHCMASVCRHRAGCLPPSTGRHAVLSIGLRPRLCTPGGLRGGCRCSRPRSLLGSNLVVALRPVNLSYPWVQVVPRTSARGILHPRELCYVLVCHPRPPLTQILNHQEYGEMRSCQMAM